MATQGPSVPVKRGMGTGTKVALGCGGCAVLVIFCVVAMAVLGALSRTKADAGRTAGGNGVNTGSKAQPRKVAAGELFRAFQANAPSAEDQFRGGYVLIECQVSDTKRIVKSIGKGVDPDSTLNLDSLVATVPSDLDLEKEASVTGISTDQLRGTFPSIGLELSGDSRRPSDGGDAPGMSLWGDVLFVFDTHPEALKKLRIGKRVQIIGRVDGWLHQSVLVKDCQLVAE